ncbi:MULTISPECIES: hypothetical protein [unclassified Streptomyces]|uniref:hypothetical protein n=1 Tax=unclassified Streptomyces TaxID=2593676 RepID=UPI0006AF7DBE|nr:MULTISPECIES: hypothetical protein [unclassified Streptomyces]KOX33025.1 hypothetical protein ADL06_09775 [Streptomyces sp. NRRL F-6491]KOX49525.1 hypothetical protein ADL08_08470 [Streptomyces sp. NRRL F-6492]
MSGVSEDQLAEALEGAVGEVLATLGLGILSRMTLSIEVIDRDGDLGLFTVAAPANMPVWDRIGLLRYALTELEANSVGHAVAARLRNEEDE